MGLGRSHKRSTGVHARLASDQVTRSWALRTQRPAIFIVLRYLVLLLTVAAVRLPPTRGLSDGPSDEIMPPSSCEHIASFLPPRRDPAVILQVVSRDFIEVEENFIISMETHAASATQPLTRENLFLVCLDGESEAAFARLGIRCWNVRGVRTHPAIWKLRVKVLACLAGSGGHTVILSDSDALWLGNPMEYVEELGLGNSSVIAQRGSFPGRLSRKWGATMCMGFAIFLNHGGTGMEEFLREMLDIVSRVGDDQIAVNEAAEHLGVVWGKDPSASDMRYWDSTGIGQGLVGGLPADFTLTLLPHDRYTRDCNNTPLSPKTIVAHCLASKKVEDKLAWMKESGLWYVGGQSPGASPVLSVTLPGGGGEEHAGNDGENANKTSEKGMGR